MYFRGACLLAASVALAGCALGKRAVLTQYMEEDVAIVITALVEPLLLADEASALGVNVGDYLQLTPVEINRSGDFNYYLSMVFWSTVDRQQTDNHHALERVTLMLDSVPMQLQLSFVRVGGGANRLDVIPAPVAGAVQAYYSLTVSQIRELGAAQSLYVLGSQPDTRYRPLGEASNALLAFFEYASDGKLR